MRRPFVLSGVAAVLALGAPAVDLSAWRGESLFATFEHGNDGASAVPYKPNTFMESKPEEAFWCGFYPAAKGLGGFLRWAFNSWPYDPRHDASFGHWRAGDTFLVYPDGESSVRFFELRCGIQAAEKFNILKASGADAEALAALAAKYDYWTARKTKADLAPLKVETLSVVNR